MKMLKFRQLSILNSAVCTLLFLLLLFFPNPIFFLFGLKGNETAFFICRRASMLFGGYAIISFFLKDLQMSRVRQMISLGFAFSMSGFAFMGTIEYIRGFAGAGIFSAVIGELFLALLYLSTWFSDRKNGITEGIES